MFESLIKLTGDLVRTVVAPVDAAASLARTVTKLFIDAVEAVRDEVEDAGPDRIMIPENCGKCGTWLEDAGPVGLICPNPKCDVVDGPFDGSDPPKNKSPDRCSLCGHFIYDVVSRKRRG